MLDMKKVTKRLTIDKTCVFFILMKTKQGGLYEKVYWYLQLCYWFYICESRASKTKVWHRFGCRFHEKPNHTIFSPQPNTFNGNLRFGLTDDLELGIGYTYEYYYLADNIMQYFAPMRRSGSTLDQSDYPWYKRDRFFNTVTNKEEDQQPWRTVNGTTGEVSREKYESIGDVIGLTAESDSLPIEFTSQPIDLLLNPFAFESIFNPIL
jgi:hypothetical protein